MEWKNRRDQEVGRVDDLVDLEIHADAANRVGLLPGKVMLTHQVLDHVTQHIARGHVEIFG
jgi:hypothetical protein